MTRQPVCFVVVLLFTAMCGAALAAADAPVDHHPSRKIVRKVLPAYPDLARQLRIRGLVKLLVTVEPGGKVKSAKALGGNPAFVAAAMDVISKWKFEPAPAPTTETIEIEFKPGD